MVKFASKIPKESIIDIKARVTVPENEVKECSQKVELQITEIWVVNKSAPMLPFQLEDASRPVENQEEEEKQHQHIHGQHPKGEETKEAKHAVVGQDVRLNNRYIDLRVPANQALMRIQSGVG
jgi:aspartyl-tRNA synthetase